MVGIRGTLIEDAFHRSLLTDSIPRLSFQKPLTGLILTIIRPMDRAQSVSGFERRDK
jgi:hypothetical protein